MRLVQRAMLPGSGHEHLAEVFLSGLLVRADPAAPASDPDAVVYEFRDGVREQLLGSLTQPESLRVLEVLSGVSGTVASLFGGSLNFRALAPAPASAGPRSLSPQSRPFAQVAASVLSGLGGVYGDLARTITQATADGGAAPVDPAQVLRDEVSTLPETDQDDELAVEAVPEEISADPPQEQASAGPQPAYPEGWPSASAPLSSGKIYQPVLFVGLGGTGCDIGAELERPLRQEICGPDGNDFRRNSPARTACCPTSSRRASSSSTRT